MFKHWEKKHPIGQLVRMIGDTDKLCNFYEYQMYCKNLQCSIKTFTRKTQLFLQTWDEECCLEAITKRYKLEDRQNIHIYTIDPETQC